MGKQPRWRAERPCCALGVFVKHGTCSTGGFRGRVPWGRWLLVEETSGPPVPSGGAGAQQPVGGCLCAGRALKRPGSFLPTCSSHDIQGAPTAYGELGTQGKGAALLCGSDQIGLSQCKFRRTKYGKRPVGNDENSGKSRVTDSPWLARGFLVFPTESSGTL